MPSSELPHVNFLWKGGEKMNMLKKSRLEDDQLDIKMHYVDPITPCSTSSNVWVTVGRTELTLVDKNVLCSDDWLNDKHIHAAQQLLKEQSPYIGKLQDPMMQVTHSFEVESGEFVQILNVNENHWLTISTIQCSPGHVKLYNSIPSCIPSSTKQTIAELLHTTCKQISIEYVNMQSQIGSSACGLFAIATATALVHGHNPYDINFTQPLMREHLLNALETGVLSPFPHKKAKRSKKILREEMVPVYCNCRLPDDGTLMVQCIKCNLWYHVHCVQCPKHVLQKKNRPWCCESCI